ncbi:MAG: hypothetical protein AB7H77_00650 [Bdellovibrionales bacterium]
MMLKLNYNVEARVVGTTLVAAFHKSNPSIVWKFDLERNHSFTISLHAKDSDFELGVASPKGEFYSIARFPTYEDAEEALRAVQKALMTKKMDGKWLRRALFAVCAVAAVLFMIAFIGYLLAGKMPSAPEKPVVRNGVPLPADQVLRPPP